MEDHALYNKLNELNSECDKVRTNSTSQVLRRTAPCSNLKKYDGRTNK